MATKSLPYGPGNAHVLQSKGADHNITKFYITEYSTNYKHGTDRFIPRDGKHVGTGYKSNFRAGVYYNRRIDELDNPTMGRIVADNYASITRKHYLPCTSGSNGHDPFPQDLALRSSGFIKDIPMTTPRSHQVAQVFVDKRERGITYPKEIPYLQRIQPKDPISLENLGYGPKYMTTENHAKYRGLPNVRWNTSAKTVGRKEGSGFTHAYNNEPITFRPLDAYGRQAVHYTRPIGVSIMKTTFEPFQHGNGREKLPLLAKGSERGTGFTREAMGKPAFYLPNKDKIFTEVTDVPPLVQDKIQRDNPMEFLNLTNPHNRTSVAGLTFKGMQHNDPSLAEKLANSTLGNKEPTGFTENNGQYFEHFETPATLKRFKTHYATQFYDKNPEGESRFGRTAGHAMSLLPDGFTKSTAVHDHGPEIDVKQQLQTMQPYVARSIKARDPLFVDTTHHAKRHVTTELTS